tara:strand:+ start:3994 stop:4329 length:336 start_codon:yes stop_codon:yes gene_type:complete
MSLENNIKEWVNYDNHINELNNKIKDLKDKRNIKEDEIHSLLRTKDKLPIIQISDGLLKFTTQNVQQPLSFKFIESCLLEKFNKNDVNSIIQYIKNKRISKENFVIKRFYK